MLNDAKIRAAKSQVRKWRSGNTAGIAFVTIAIRLIQVGDDRSFKSRHFEHPNGI